MRVKIVVVCLGPLLVSSNTIEAKPGTTEPTESPVYVFVGYSVDAVNNNKAWIFHQGTVACMSTFGESARVADAAQMKAAMADGSYTFPATFSAFLSSNDAVPVVATYSFTYHPELELFVRSDDIAYIAPNGSTNIGGRSFLSPVACAVPSQ